MDVGTDAQFRGRGGQRRSVTFADNGSPGEVGGQQMQKRIYDPPSVIADPMGPTLVDLLEKNYRKKRHEIVLQDGTIVTPLKVIKDLSFDYGSPLEIKTFEIHLPKEKNECDRIRHRVSITMGALTGDGETPRYRLALQIAAADLLEKLKRDNHTLQTYGLLPGSRVSPWVYRDLKELCEMEKLASLPTYSRVGAKDVGSNHVFAFKCMVGQAETIGTSDSIFLAKRIATKMMFEALTGEAYPDERVATGRGCLNHDDFRAMGINPVASVRSVIRSDSISSGIPVSEGRSTGSSFMMISEELYEDEFAEDEDNIVLVREQLECIKLD